LSSEQSWGAPDVDTYVGGAAYHAGGVATSGIRRLSHRKLRSGPGVPAPHGPAWPSAQVIVVFAAGTVVADA
jgi:hypothetical protein